MTNQNLEKRAVDLFAVALSRSLGDSRVIVDSDILAQFSRDKSHCEGVMPDVAVRVKSEDELTSVLKMANEYNVPVVARGAGTGKAGGAIPLRGGLVLDMTRLDQLLEVDRENLLAVVRPGIVTGNLQSMVENEGLFYPPDPNSLDTCTIGGNVAHNAGGPRAFKYGVTREYVMGLRSVLMGGDVVVSGKRTVKGVTGYDVTALMVGSEGTLGVFSQITLRLTRKPPVLSTLLIPMPDEESAGIAVSRIVAAGIVPRVLEFMDTTIVDVLRTKGVTGIDDGTGALILAEMDGDSEELVERATLQLADVCETLGAGEILMARHGGDREKLWAARRVMSDAVAETARHKVSEDIVVPRSLAPQLLTGLKKISKRFGVKVASYGHAGDGNYHVNVLWDDEGFNVTPVVAEVFRLTLALGGTITGEHGVGIAKKPYLPWEQGTSLIALQRSIKQVFDPKGLLNPDKIF
ncbi:MAG: FAD-binding protein [Deltaproteobacteria bacterium]|nr:FAD-binding protein [Deltaproteobacteria bacterium]